MLPLSETISSYRSEILLFIIILIGLQFLLITFMMIFSVLFRIHQNRRTRQLKRKYDLWYDLIFAYFDTSISIQDFRKKVPSKDFPDFIDFSKDFFLDFEGEDKEQLRMLMIELGLDSYLIEKLHGRNTWERVHAIFSLGLMNCLRSVPMIRQALQDRSELVRLTAASNLMQVRDIKSLETILVQLGSESDEEFRNLITLNLLEFGPSVLPELERIFTNLELEEWVKKICVDVFAYYVHMDANDAIIETFKTAGSIDLKASCLKALAASEDPGLESFFEDQLQSETIEIKIMAASALGRLGIPSSIPRLAEYAEHNDFWIAKRSIEALAQMGNDGEEMLLSILNRADASMTRDLIIEVLRNDT